jgi:LacI family transcriptional regulator
MSVAASDETSATASEAPVRAPSLRGIAQLAGVSASTVSLALHGSSKIPAATRRKIRALADRVGYRPSAKVAELMEQIRASRGGPVLSCLGVISLYDHPRPWENSEHLRRIHASMAAHALKLGYRLETLWMRAPGMTYQRFRTVLDARGIQGLICFGSPALDDKFPAELDHYAIVTVGLSIQTPLHRVTSHIYSDTVRALEKIYQLGYRRPGLVLSTNEDVRGAHTHVSAYLGWHDRKLPRTRPIPALIIDAVKDRRLGDWLKRHQPDVMVFAHMHEAVRELAPWLRQRGIEVPQQLGVAVVSHFLEGTGFSGMQQNQADIGSWAVELVLARIAHQDLGIPTHPRIEMVESEWVEGTTLRAK